MGKVVLAGIVKIRMSCPQWFCNHRLQIACCDFSKIQTEADAHLNPSLTAVSPLLDAYTVFPITYVMLEGFSFLDAISAHTNSFPYCVLLKEIVGNYFLSQFQWEETTLRDELKDFCWGGWMKAGGWWFKGNVKRLRGWLYIKAKVKASRRE